MSSVRGADNQAPHFMGDRLAVITLVGDGRQLRVTIGGSSVGIVAHVRAEDDVMPAPAVLEILKNSGIERIIVFFERDAAGNFHAADFQEVPVEVAIAFLRFVRRAFAIKAADRL
jgi:hypothetical protein